MTAGHGDISVQGFVTAQKEHVRFCRSTTSSTTWWTKRATSLVLQPLQLFQICPLLSMEWIWTCGLAHHHHYFWHSVHCISGALNEHYLNFWALKSSTKRQKKQRTLKALLNPNFTSTKLSALVYNFRNEFGRYKAGPVRCEPCLVESSAEWTRSLPLSWVRWSTVTGCKSFFYRFFFMVLVLS